MAEQVEPKSSTSNETDVASTFRNSWRYRIGLFLIIGGHALLLLGFVLPAIGVLSIGVAGVTVISAELIALSSIVFLGKQGFIEIKNQIFGAVKGAYLGPVSATRHYLGIALFLTSVLTNYVTYLFAWSAYTASTPDQPALEVWGLGIEAQASLIFWVFVIGEVCFVASIYILGADWWGRFRRIFVLEAPT